MKHIQMPFAATIILSAAMFVACSSDGGGEHSSAVSESRGEHDRDGGEHGREGRGEHDRDGDGHHGEEGEESGTELALHESYDEVRNGARLMLAYDR